MRSDLILNIDREIGSHNNEPNEKKKKRKKSAEYLLFKPWRASLQPFSSELTCTVHGHANPTFQSAPTSRNKNASRETRRNSSFDVDSLARSESGINCVRKV